MPSSVSLGTKLESVVDDLVGKGRYNSRSEVLREGVRLVQEREAWLADLDASLERGLADFTAGRVHDADDVLAELDQRYANWPDGATRG